MVRREFSRGNFLAARVTALVALDVPSQTASAALRGRTARPSDCGGREEWLTGDRKPEE